MNVLTKIERLKRKMNNMAAAGADYKQILKTSQQLDQYVVEYQKAMFVQYQTANMVKRKV